MKRIQPAAFSPPYLSREVHTTLHWAFEGITSYYDDLALVRSGRIAPQSYVELLARSISRLLRTTGRHRQSLAESSFDAWEKFSRRGAQAFNNETDLYGKGAIVCALIFPLIWFVPTGWPETAYVAYLAIALFLYFAVYSFFDIPHIALAFEATPGPELSSSLSGLDPAALDGLLEGLGDGSFKVRARCGEAMAMDDDDLLVGCPGASSVFAYVGCKMTVDRMGVSEDAFIDGVEIMTAEDYMKLAKNAKLNMFI